MIKIENEINVVTGKREIDNLYNSVVRVNHTGGNQFDICLIKMNKRQAMNVAKQLHHDMLVSRDGITLKSLFPSFLTFHNDPLEESYNEDGNLVETNISYKACIMSLNTAARWHVVLITEEF